MQGTSRKFQDTEYEGRRKLQVASYKLQVTGKSFTLQFWRLMVPSGCSLLQIKDFAKIKA